MICDFCRYFNKGRCFAQKDAPVMIPEYNIAHCDVYNKTVEDDPLRNQKLRIHYTPNKEVES